MPTYLNSGDMFRDIKAHVQGTGHGVLPEDDPLRRMIGYKCPTCETLWTVGLVGLQGVGISGVSLTELVQDQGFRDRITTYLNFGVVPKPLGSVPGSVLVLSRYKRPWVV